MKKLKILKLSPDSRYLQKLALKYPPKMRRFGGPVFSSALSRKTNLVVRTACGVSEKVAHGGLIVICKYVISPGF